MNMTADEVRWQNRRDDTEDRARKIIVEHLGVDAGQVTTDVRFIPEDGKPHEPADGHLGADSLDLVELTMAFEEEFGVDIADDEVEQLVTFGDAVKLVESKRS